MNMHYDVAKAEIATRVQYAEHHRTAKRAQTRQRSGHTPRWQRFRST